ncbi:alpha/beta hydrolase [Halovulum sp. GXIMD14794]
MRPAAHSPDLFCAPPEGPAREVDLLLVHGIGAGAWIWPDEGFDLFAHRGYRTWAISLTGAGSTLDDYADQLDAALDRIDRPTVVLAHSLGGAVAQKLLARGRPVAGTVLICSVPPYGLWRASAELFWRNPGLWQQMWLYSFRGLAQADMDVLRRELFPSGIDDAAFARIAVQLGDESLKAMGATAGWPPFAPPPLSQRNVMVIGGARDPLVPPADVQLTALYYGVTPHVLPDAGHMLMLEPAGRAAAELVLDWLPGVEAGQRPPKAA